MLLLCKVVLPVVHCENGCRVAGVNISHESCVYSTVSTCTVATAAIACAGQPVAMASKEMMAPVDDLYADVVDLPIPEPVERSVRAQSLVERVQELENLSKRLKRENGILKRNIGTLFRTATSELDRKDRLIQELRAQVSKNEAQMGVGKPKDGRKDATEAMADPDEKLEVKPKDATLEIDEKTR